jgi:hypothetical protein
MRDEGFVVADSLKELSDMAEVRAVLQNLCAAVQLAAQLNRKRRVKNLHEKSFSVCLITCGSGK